MLRCRKSTNLTMPMGKKEVVIQPNDHKNTLFWLNKEFY